MPLRLEQPAMEGGEGGKWVASGWIVGVGVVWSGPVYYRPSATAQTASSGGSFAVVAERG